MAAKRTDWTPTLKVGGGGIGGAASIIVLWLLDSYTPLDVPDAAAAAIGVLVTFGVAYLLPGANPPPTGQ